MVIEDLLSRINKVDYFVLLQPTSPMRDEVHIKEACDIFENVISKYDFLVSVKEAEHSGILVKPIDDDQSLKSILIQIFQIIVDKVYKEYSPNGAIFIGET